MTPRRVTRRSGLLLTLACCLGLLAPAGAATRPPAAGAAVEAALAGPAAGPGQDLLRDPPAGQLLGAGSRRDERERPGPALPGLLAAAPALAAALVAGRRGGGPTRRRGPATVPARAPPGPLAAV
jgi:hypothetical protein